jgi:hypothetical protein
VTAAFDAQQQIWQLGDIHRSAAPHGVYAHTHTHTSLSLVRANQHLATVFCSVTNLQRAAAAARFTSCVPYFHRGFFEPEPIFKR